MGNRVASREPGKRTRTPYMHDHLQLSLELGNPQRRIWPQETTSEIGSGSSSDAHLVARGAATARDRRDSEQGPDLELELLAGDERAMEDRVRALAASAAEEAAGSVRGPGSAHATQQHGALAYLPSSLARLLQTSTLAPDRSRAGASVPRAPAPAASDADCGVLFVDVAGFTALETAIFAVSGADGARAAAALAGTLNAFLRPLLEEALSHARCCRCDVSVEAFAGDALLIVFSAAGAGCVPPALAAARCAAGLVARAAANAHVGPAPLSLHIGVGAGSVSRCYPGTETRRHSVCGGPAVEESCAAEPQAKSGEVACGPAALEAIRRHWPAARAEGLAGGFALLHLPSLGPCAPHRPMPVPPPPPPPPPLAAAASLFVPLVVRHSLQDGLPSWHDEARLDRPRRHPARPPPQVREASVVFLSIGGVLRPAAAPPAVAAAAEWVPGDSHAEATGSPFQEAVARAVAVVEGVCERKGGILNKVIVDDKGCVAVVAFGLPYFAHLDDPLRAVSAASEATAALAAAGCPSFAGVATGRVFAGIVGDPTLRCEYTVLGRTVNLAARLMQHAASGGAGRVLCDFATCRRAQQRATFAKPPLALQLKGFPGITEARALARIADRHASSRGRHRHGGAPAGLSPLVGRAAQVKEAAALLLAAAGGRPDAPRALLVEGPAGVGKSAFLAAVENAAGQRGLPSLALSGDPARGEPYSAWREALRPVLAAWSQQPAGSRRNSSGGGSGPQSRVQSAESLAGAAARATARELVLRRLAALLPPAHALDARAVACLPLLNALHPRLAIPETAETRSMDPETRRRETERLALLVLRAHAAECAAVAGLFGGGGSSRGSSSRGGAGGRASWSGRPSPRGATGAGLGLEARRVAAALAAEPAWAWASDAVAPAAHATPHASAAGPSPREATGTPREKAGACILLVVDHVCWLDNASLALALAAAAPGGPAVLLAAYRSADPTIGRQAAARREAVAAVARPMPLGPLSESDTLALARSVLGTRSLGPAAARFLRERSAGVPLVVHEIAEALEAGGLLVRSAGGEGGGGGPPPLAAAEGDGDSDAGSTLELVSLEGAAEAVPAEFSALVVSRVSGLPFRTQLLVKVAAVCGLQFPVTLLCAVHPQSAAASPFTLARALSGRAVAELGLERVRGGAGDDDGSGADSGTEHSGSDDSLFANDAPEPTFRWKHERIRSAALELLTPALRRSLHTRAALHLSDERRAGRADDAAVAYHWEAAGRRRLAALALKRLAFAARRLFDNATAVDALERSLALNATLRADAARASLLTPAAAAPLAAEEAVARSELGAALLDEGCLAAAIEHLAAAQRLFNERSRVPPPPAGWRRALLAALGALARQLLRRLGGSRVSPPPPPEPRPPRSGDAVRDALEGLLAAPAPDAPSADAAAHVEPPLRAVLAAYDLAEAHARSNAMPQMLLGALRALNTAEARGPACGRGLARGYSIVVNVIGVLPAAAFGRLRRAYLIEALEHARASDFAERAKVLYALVRSAILCGEAGRARLLIQYGLAQARAAGSAQREEVLRGMALVLALYLGDLRVVEAEAEALRGSTVPMFSLLAAAAACLAAAQRHALGWPPAGPPLAERAAALQAALAPSTPDSDRELACGALAFAAAVLALGGDSAHRRAAEAWAAEALRVASANPAPSVVFAAAGRLYAALGAAALARGPGGEGARALAGDLLRAARLIRRLARANGPLAQAAAGLLALPASPRRAAREWRRGERAARALGAEYASSPIAVALALAGPAL